MLNMADGYMANHSSKFSFAPKITCETVRQATVSKDCGAGMGLGMAITSKTGNTMFQADLEYDDIGGTKRRSLKLSFQHRF